MKIIISRLTACLFLFISAATALAQGSVHFVSPHDRATVPRTFKVEMGVAGMTVEPAGEIKEGTGHHHLIIDGKPIPAGEAVPANDNHMHFGKGQTETTLTLTPGEHSLTLQFADGNHLSYGPAMSSTITVQVE